MVWVVFAVASLVLHVQGWVMWLHVPACLAVHPRLHDQQAALVLLAAVIIDSAQLSSSSAVLALGYIGLGIGVVVARLWHHNFAVSVIALVLGQVTFVICMDWRLLRAAAFYLPAIHVAISAVLMVIASMFFNRKSA